MCCNDCIKLKEVRDINGAVVKKCSNDPNGTGVNGFHYCADWKGVACTMCKHVHSLDGRCVLCVSLDGKPYFEKVEVVEND